MLALPIIDSEAEGKSLVIVGLRLGRGMRFACLALRLESGDVLRPRQWQQIAEFCCINEIRGLEIDAPWSLEPCIGTFDRHPANLVSALPRMGTDRPVIEQNLDPPATDMGREHLGQHRQGNTRFMAQFGHPAVAGIEVLDPVSFAG